MSLESLLKPVKWTDQKVLKQYTKLGRKIPEKNLYNVTMALGFLGNLGSFVLPLVLTVPYGVMLAPNLVLDIYGLMNGNTSDYHSNGNKIIDDAKEKPMQMTRITRLPLFLAGMGLVGKVVYDTANFFINGEPFENENYHLAVGGFGFLSAASSMYLKDQDPKLLDKNPNRVKSFLKNWYEKAKSVVKTPTPTPQPIPIEFYSTIDNYVTKKTIQSP